MQMQKSKLINVRTNCIIFYLYYNLGVVFAFVWASFLPPVRRNDYNKEVIAELMMHNNNEQSELTVSRVFNDFLIGWDYYSS